MPWQDRVRRAACTSPAGFNFVFDYEDVSKSFEKKTTAFEFPDADGTFIQDLGRSGRKYPLRMIFWGPDYDEEADAFEEALFEKGTWKLEHPIYGTVNVVPFGEITRTDALKTAANQAVFQIVFWETIDVIYPSSQADPASSVGAAVDEYNSAAAIEFDEVTDLDSAVEQSTFKNQYQALLDVTKTGLQAIADTQQDVATRFNAITDSINNSLDFLVGQPLTLAAQTLGMIQTPALSLTSIQDRLTKYSDLAQLIISGETATPGNDSRNSNEFHNRDLYASTYVTGSIISVINNQFTTKTEALEAAESVLSQFEAVAIWRDDNFQSLDELDQGAAYQQLQEAVALTAGFLVEISFSLLQERRITLTSPRTIIDLVAELYGSVDDQLDFFINTNDLTGSEIIELPRGREIVFYT